MSYLQAHAQKRIYKLETFQTLIASSPVLYHHLFLPTRMKTYSEFVVVKYASLEVKSTDCGSQ